MTTKWYKVSDYSITNGQELTGPGYKHGTHIISKSVVNGQNKFTLYRGEKLIAVKDKADDLKRMVEGKSRRASNEMEM